MRRLAIVLLAMSAGTAASAQDYMNNPNLKPRGHFFGNPQPTQPSSPGFSSPSYALPRQPPAYPAYKPHTAPTLSEPIGGEVPGFKPYKPWKGNSVYGDQPYNTYRPKYGSTYGN